MDKRRVDGIQIGEGGTCFDVERELLLKVPPEVYLAYEVADKVANLPTLVFTR